MLIVKIYNINHKYWETQAAANSVDPYQMQKSVVSD